MYKNKWNEIMMEKIVQYHVENTHKNRDMESMEKREANKKMKCN